MDAMPVTLGDEFIAYAMQLFVHQRKYMKREMIFLEVAIGGTATGTGVNTRYFIGIMC